MGAEGIVIRCRTGYRNGVCAVGQAGYGSGCGAIAPQYGVTGAACYAY